MEAIIFRLEWNPPSVLHWSTGWRRKLLGGVKIMWEFNTIPEYGRYQGADDSLIARSRQKLKHFSPGCDLAICVSNNIADYVQAEIGIKNVLAFTNGSDPDLFRPGLEAIDRIRKLDDRLNIVWVGSADIGWHDLDALRESAEIIWNSGECDRFQFHIIGKGLDNIRKFPANVHYHGAEKYNYLPYWLSGMDIGLVLYKPGPADYSSPLKLFDYLSSGLTVIGLEHPQLREIFTELGQVDLLVPHNRPDLLAELIICLEGNRKRLKQQGELGRKLVLEKYSWQAVVSGIINSIQNIDSKIA